MQDNTLDQLAIDKLIARLSRKQRRKILKLKGMSYSKYVYELFKDVKI